ncbi:MAG: TRAP transporter substrate-binding protein DctP [Bacteriovoracaceae bacterium]|nr:TRAP transporter substrate-binding protein DctP [Bacteriovoracaceae bacterium]
MKMFLILFSCLLVTMAHAEKIKLAVLTPEGTSWSNSLADMTKEIKSVTKGEIDFRIYYGGVAGDESDVVRKIRVGQLHGGFFTGKTLGEFTNDLRVVEIPFTFHHDRAKAWKMVEALTNDFSTSLRKNGFESLGYYEIGQVYVISTKKVNTLNELKGIKIWSWEGDQIVKAMVDSLQLVSIPLALPDVLSSLSTGIIEAAYAPPMGILALQWQTKIKYLVDYPVAFSIGALLISNKIWDKISPANQKIIKEIASKYIKQTNAQTVLDNTEALNALKNSGITFIKFPDSDIQQADNIRKDVVKRIVPQFISTQGYQKLEKLLK